MRLESFFRVLFVVYCLEAGLFLVVLPWTPTWDRLAMLSGFGGIGGSGAHGVWGAAWLRGAITGFGLSHLVWAVHDLDLFLRRSPGR